MGNSNEYIGKRLYDLVQSLTRKEKIRFRSFLSTYQPSKKGDEKDYLRLFEFLNKSKAFNEGDLLSSIFHNNKASYNRAGRYLVKLIFESLAYYGDRNRIYMIQRALEKEFFQFATKTILEEARLAKESENLSYLFELYEIRESIFRIYRINIDFPQNYPTIEEVASQLQLFHSSKLQYYQFKKLIKSSSENRILAYHSWKDEIYNPSNEATFNRVSFQLAKTKMIHSRLGGEISKAIAFQGKAISIMDAHPKLFPISETIIEKILWLFLAFTGGQYDKALEIIEELEQLELKSSELAAKVYQSKLIVELYVALETGDMKSGKGLLQDLEGKTKDFPSNYKALVYYAASLLEMANGYWDQVIYWTSKINRLSEKARKGIIWVPFLQKAIAYYQLGEKSEAQRSIAQAQKYIETCGAEYPHFILSGINRLFFNSPKEDKNRAIESILEALNTFKKTEPTYVDIFNLGPYLEFLKHNLPSIPIDPTKGMYLVKLRLVS